MMRKILTFKPKSVEVKQRENRENLKILSGCEPELVRDNQG